MEEFEKIEIRSEEVQEILGTPPRWIIRWGTMLIIAGVGLLGFVSYIVKYPDVVVVPLTITTTVEPVQVVAQRNGHLSRFLVKENEAVKYNDILVVIQNPAKLEDVLFLDSLTIEMQLFSIPDFVEFTPPTNLSLGELQPDYSRFIQLFKEFTNEVSSRYDVQRKNTLDLEIESIKASIKTLELKQVAAETELAIAAQTLKVAQDLYAQKVESQQAVQRAAANKASLEKQIEAIRSEISDKNVAIARIETQKVEIGVNTHQSQKGMFVELQEQINKLKTNIEEWKLQNILVAPIEGTVSFAAEFRSAQQFITKDDIIMSIVPKEGDRLIGKSFLPTSGLGKVAIGNRVVMRIDGYPYEEWGIVEGVFESKGQIPNKNSQYPITIYLPKGLMTSSSKELHFDQQMRGVAEIISEDRRFIERIFDQFRALFKKY